MIGVVCITGVTGFLGRSLAVHFHSQGSEVRGCTHRGSHSGPPDGVLQSSWRQRLGDPCPAAAFEGCNLVIHCAHDFTAGGRERNVTGTGLLRRAASQAGVREQLFISSVSARPDAVSDYGKTKYAIEQEFLAAGLAVLRPGLVVGPGGLFARNVAALRKAPFVPLPDGGRAPCPVVDLRDLLSALDAVTRGKASGAFNLFVEPSPSLREFVAALLAAIGQRKAMLPFPSRWAPSCGRLLRGVGLQVPAAIERLETMRLNALSDVHRSDLKRLIDATASLDQMLSWACEEVSGRPTE